MPQAFMIKEWSDGPRQSTDNVTQKEEVQYQVPKYRYFTVLVTGKELKNLQDQKWQSSITFKETIRYKEKSWHTLEMKQWKKEENKGKLSILQGQKKKKKHKTFLLFLHNCSLRELHRRGQNWQKRAIRTKNPIRKKIEIEKKSHLYKTTVKNLKR